MTTPSATLAPQLDAREFPRPLILWIVGIGIFGLLATLTGTTTYVLYIKAGQAVSFFEIWTAHLSQWLPWGMVVPVIAWLTQRMPFRRTNWLRPGLIHLLVSVLWLPVNWVLTVLGTTLRGAAPWSNFWTNVRADFGLSRLMDYYWYWVILLAIHAWLFLRAALRHQRAQARLELKNMALNQSLTEARLAGLQAQLQPHFLYNTHNTIAALIRAQKNDEALKVLHQLSNLLRYNLSRQPHQLVPVADEIAFLEQYLDIQKMRFPTRLRCRIHLEPGCEEALIPPMLLQPLMENAVQHGILSERNGDTITLSITRPEDDLIIEMTNATGPESTDSKGFGIGLKNTRTRLRHLFGDHQSLELVFRDDQRIAATLTLPYRTSHE